MGSDRTPTVSQISSGRKQGARVIDSQSMAQNGAGALPKKTIFVLGHGSVSKALLCLLRLPDSAVEAGLSQIGRVSVLAPEIEKDFVDRISCGARSVVFEWKHGPAVDKDNLGTVLNQLQANPGDILIELATRIDTPSIWKEAKDRKLHFINTGFDAWPDETLTCKDILNFKDDPLFDGETGLTTVLSMGMNPGIISHFVSHGLKKATGLDDPSKAAKEFGLKAIVFSERDNQWPAPGSEQENLLLHRQDEEMICTWSPRNFFEEASECDLDYPGMPDQARGLRTSYAPLISWTPSGPIVGFPCQHDETFTVQSFFENEASERSDVPTIFIYEAPPSARAYLVSSRGQGVDSQQLKQQPLNPAEFDVCDNCYDILGALLLSSKREPFWCGVSMTVADAQKYEESGTVGPTPLQVVGGIWAALQYVLLHPNVGDCVSEDLPTDFVIQHCLPHCGVLTTKSCPEALNVSGFFDPSAADSWDLIKAAMANTLVDCEDRDPKDAVNPDARIDSVEARMQRRKSGIHGDGCFSTTRLREGACIVQLPPGRAPKVLGGGAAFPFNHCCHANAYVDRNWAVRARRCIEVGEEITVDYAMCAAPLPAPPPPPPPSERRHQEGGAARLGEGGRGGDREEFPFRCNCGACRFTRTAPGAVDVTSLRAMRAEAVAEYLETLPILREIETEVKQLPH